MKDKEYIHLNDASYSYVLRESFSSFFFGGFQEGPWRFKAFYHSNDDTCGFLCSILRFSASGHRNPWQISRAKCMHRLSRGKIQEPHLCNWAGLVCGSQVRKQSHATFDGWFFHLSSISNPTVSYNHMIFLLCLVCFKCFFLNDEATSSS
jgi:hypothetical protein